MHLSVPLLFHRCFLKHHPQMTTIHGVCNWTCQEEWQDLCFYISTSYKHSGGRVCSWLHLNPGAGDWGLCCSQDQSSVVSRGKRMKCKSLRLCIALENPCWPHEPLVQLIEHLFTIQTPSALTKIRSAGLATVSGQLQESLSLFGNHHELLPSVCDACFGQWPSQLMSIFILWLLSHLCG